MEICLLVIILLLAAALLLQRRSQRKTLERMDVMLQEARSGSFSPERMDETMLSSIENSMKLFLQDSLLQEENLKEQKGKIQTLISDISHQTITPLSNILVYSQLLEEELAGQGSLFKAQAVRRQAEKLDFLLQSLVKTSRLETGIVTLLPSRCRLQGILEEAAEQVQRKAEEKGISLTVRPEEAPVFACCDAKWTLEACFNILDNAVKYTEPGGRVTAGVREFPMFACMEIQDTGIGMEETEIPKIFQRFYRSRQTAEAEGVGLGLCLTREIIEGQGGYLKVATRPGAGSTFSVFLPRG